MERIVIILYAMIYVFLLLAFSINKCRIKNISLLIESCSVTIYKEEIIDKCNLLINKYKDVNISYSKYYNFNSQTNTLGIVNKQKYTLYDLWIVNHEIGHIMDYYSGYHKMYNIVSGGKNAFYILWIIVLFSSISIMFAESGVGIIVLGLYTVIIFIWIAIVGTISVIEYRASKNALDNWDFSVPDKRVLHKVVKLSILDQILYWMMLIQPIWLTLILNII